MRKGGHDTVRLAGREIDEGGITGENMLIKYPPKLNLILFSDRWDLKHDTFG